MICTLNSRISVTAMSLSLLSLVLHFPQITLSSSTSSTPHGPQIVPVPFISISNQSSTFSVSLTRFLVLNPHRIHLSAMLYLALFKEPAL